MKQKVALSLILAGAMVLGACNDSSNGGIAVVAISGPASVRLGLQIQLTATTVNGSDSAYVWTSSNPLVASVDNTGLVTGLADGQTTITATGANTGASGSYPVFVTADPSQGLPNFQAWSTSGHNDQTAEAFRHWDGDGEIPTSCARCHSTPGFRDYVGADGSAPDVVDQPAPLGSTVECTACHNEATEMLDTVTFPSGVQIFDLGREAVCMTCHQGRSSTDGVDAAIAAAAPADDDTVMPDRGFINVHYFPAAATRYGGEVRGGYLYAGKKYDVLFRHVPGLERCQDCHSPHSLEIRLEVCQDCHTAATEDDLKNIRMESSLTRDYDGDGDLFEGLYFEIDTLRQMLLATIQNYANEVIGSPIVYDPGSYPYFFNDTNANGVVDAGEASFGNRYTSFTARLLKATFNYQYAVKDPGGFAHNGKFIIQLLYDSIDDLNQAAALVTKTDLSGATRSDTGHFDGTAEAFRHWDDDGEVSASCARCHSGSRGFGEYLTYKANTAQRIENGMDCATCHTTFDSFETRRITSVEFPSGLSTPVLPDTLPTSDPQVQSNICITCHQGRASKKSIDDAIAAGDLSFQNVHYLAAAATLFGTEAQVGYEYDGKTYAGKFQHAGSGSNTNNCTFCHSPSNTKHTFLPDDNKALCRICHSMPTDSIEDIRLNRPLDYDGDGDNTEPLEDELETFADALLAEIQAYAAAKGDPIVYDPDGYPYYFKDTNGNGAVDPGENIFPNRYTAWDAKLLKAAHNYQHSQKEHGAWAHNLHYILQLLYDSIEDLGDSASVLPGFTVPDRP